MDSKTLTLAFHGDKEAFRALVTVLGRVITTVVHVMLEHAPKPKRDQLEGQYLMGAWRCATSPGPSAVFAWSSAFGSFEQHVADAIGRWFDAHLPVPDQALPSPNAEWTPTLVAIALDEPGGDLQQRLATFLRIELRRSARKVLFGFRRHVGGAHEAADDLAQSFLLQLFERDAAKLRGWDPDRGRPLASYLGFISGREFVKMLKRKTKQAEVIGPLPDEPTPIVPVTVEPRPSMEEELSLELFFRAIARRLEPHERELLAMLRSDTSSEVAAERLGISVDSLAQRKGRLIKKISRIKDELGIQHWR